MLKLLMVVLCLVLLPNSFRNVLGEVSTRLDESLRNRIEAGNLHGGINTRNRTIHAQTTLSRFYEQRGYKPAWFGGNKSAPHVHTLVRLINEAAAHGLRPKDYHLDAIETLLERVGTHTGDSVQPELVDLDLLLSDAFLLYAAHLEAGRVDPETIRASFHARRAPSNLAVILQNSLESGRLEAALQTLAPRFAEYTRLKAALTRYRQIAAAGGWPTLAAPRKLQEGDRDERVVVLRQRLKITGDLPGRASVDQSVFDGSLEQGVRAFQERHGLDPDGVVGAATLAALNVPAESRVRQIELNLERWRWLPENLGERYMIVNTAAFSLDVVENGASVMDMRVVVGKPYRDTPVFSGNMTYLVLNPFWHIPPSIAVKDKLPLIRKDSAYLKRENIRVFQDWGANAKELDPSTIDWSAAGAGRFPYRLRQDPGPKNALGRVKFMFPNKFNVYLHDTPAKELFARTERTFSSGCIRIEKPLELAEYLLRENPQYSRANIVQAIARGTEQTVRLPAPVPVHLLYWTAWVDGNGSVQFRRDIYARDKRLDAVL